MKLIYLYANITDIVMDMYNDLSEENVGIIDLNSHMLVY